MDHKKYFKDKKVTLMRIGLLGRGVGDAAFLAENGAKVLVVDDAPKEVMQPSVDALGDYPNIEFKFGPYDPEDFENADMVLKGAGAPDDLPCLMSARENGFPVEMSASLFAKLSGIPIIGVTGTRGKSTVTQMIYHVLSHSTEGAPVLLGGNVRGVSNLQLLKDVQEDSIAVMELDSWQLQGFGESKISPQIAVFTNFMEDHLNYYQKEGESKEEAMEKYFADKANIFLNQEESGVFITIPEVFERAKEFAKGKNVTLGQEVVLADDSTLPEDCTLSMPGRHNRLNTALAYEALKATGLFDEEIFEGLATFPGVPGRLEFLGEEKGVRIYNDNNATSPDATIAALETFGKEKNIVLVVGGSDKGLEVEKLANVIEGHCKHVVLYSGTGTEKLKEKFSSNVDSSEFETLEDCVKEAKNMAENGDILLFSPAFASFGHEYRNEYDRNDKFVDLIESV